MNSEITRLARDYVKNRRIKIQFELIIHFDNGTKMNTWIIGYSKEEIEKYVFTQRKFFSHFDTNGKRVYKTPIALEIVKQIELR